jgi:hypothetical protein
MRKLLSTRGRAHVVAAAFVAFVVAGSGAIVRSPIARADEAMSKYVGIHPLSPHQGAFCFIDAVHYHRTPPVDMRVYVTLKGGGNLYVGDPAWLGYDGPKVGYFGPHPLAVPFAPEAGPMFCYINGPHYHATAPGPSTTMVVKDGVYWYLGPPPPVDVQRSWINEVHAIKEYAPPRVELSAAPPGYHAFHLGGDVKPAAPVTAPPSATQATAAKGKLPAGARRPAANAAAPAAPIAPVAPGGAR